ALPGLAPPLAMVGVAEKGYVTLHLTAALDEGGHSSMPPKQTAIGILSDAITKLEANPFPARIDGAARGLLDHVGPEMPLPFKIVFANMWLTEDLLKWQFSQAPTSSALIRTTTAPTIIRAGVKDNVLPSTAEAKVNFRILPGETVETVIEQVRRTIGDGRVKVEPDKASFGENPSPVSATNTFGFSVIQKSIREVFPQAIVAPALVIGATDSRHYREVSDNIYRFLPVQVANADLSRIHGQNERVSIENYKNTIRFYRQLILNSTR
ncbi:MAG: M20/M25/M40 family metallo-hydrolase, partial [Saprospiraceae bacterium]